MKLWQISEDEWVKPAYVKHILYLDANSTIWEREFLLKMCSDRDDLGAFSYCFACTASFQFMIECRKYLDDPERTYIGANEESNCVEGLVEFLVCLDRLEIDVLEQADFPK